MPFPNKNTQFQPGQSGNPTGKPKGTKHINTWVQELLEDDEFETWISDPRVGVKEFKGAPIKAIIKAQIVKAINGDTKAYDSLVKSGWVQRQEHSGIDGDPIESTTSVTYYPKGLPENYWEKGDQMNTPLNIHRRWQKGD